MSTLLTAILLAAAPTAAVDTLVVCSEAFRPALAPWVVHREAQGHEIAFVSNQGDAATVAAAIRAAARRDPPRFIVLIGAARAPAGARGDDTLAAPLARAAVNVQWGSEPDIAADSLYADFDGDRLPDAAIGRLTAATPAELATIVGKILAYENSTDFGPWRRRINIVAGLGGFGRVTDSIVEFAARRLITNHIPNGYAAATTYANWRSAFCPDPRRFPETALARLNEGSLFWVYLGHGQARALDEVGLAGDRRPILADADIDQLTNAAQPPIALLLSCYTGAFDQADGCLAEAMLRDDAGPVAAVCSSRVAMPYGMTALGMELAEQCFQERRATLGEALMAAQRALVLKDRGDAARRTLDGMAMLFDPTQATLAEQRAEHALLFNLLGDPLLVLKHPHDLTLEVDQHAAAGQTLAISGWSPLAGRCTVELITPREQLPRTAPRRARLDAPPAALDEYQAVYEQANDPRLAVAELNIPAGRFQALVDVPLDVSGACQVRVFVAGASAFGLGLAEVVVRAAESNAVEHSAARDAPAPK